jgi:hypothetical protein
MTDKEDFIVQEAYQPSKEEMKAIEALEKKQGGLVAADWDSKKKYIQEFKDNLKLDMYEKQNTLCAFCRIHVPIACVHLHREHIVYKNLHPQWTFLPENLCVSCPVCNEFKGTTEVLVNPNTKKYPQKGNGFKIIHPLYDRYSEHIELLRGILYQGKTEKGNFTIKTCHLYRTELAIERANQMYEKNNDSIIAKLIYLTRHTDLVDKKDKFLKYVSNIVEKYKKEVSKD